MSNVISDDLFGLIKSLNKSEKRYFRLFVSGQKAARPVIYLDLFDRIDRQKEYDESKIRGTGFRRERMPNLKNYLQEAILDCLLSFHAGRGKTSLIKRKIMYADLLYSKGLYGNCGKILLKAKRIALQHENYGALYEISQKEKLLLGRTSFAGISGTALEKTLQEGRLYLNKLAEIDDYRKLNIIISFHLFRYGGFRNRRDARTIRDQVTRLSANNKNLSFHAKDYLLDSLNLFYRKNGELGKSYRYGKQRMELFDARPAFIAEKPLSYLACLHNLIITCNLAGRFLESRELLIRIRALPSMLNLDKTSAIHTEIFKSYSNELDMCLLEGRFDRGLESINLIKESFERYRNKLPKTQELAFCYNMAYIYFGNSDYTESHRWLSRILNDTPAVFREDILGYTRILHWIVQYELGNRELSEYLAKSTYRFLEKKKMLHKIETAVMNFIRRRIPNVSTHEDLRNGFMGLKKEMEIILQDPAENKALSYFDFISWLESKISGIPFAEIVQKKAMTTAYIKSGK